ncbi:DMT family transporter [Neorhizobium sp. DAR64861/K0K2]|uniref:DMT family transporter n=1 Tax=unclassified Neorhizobium TaxID=2629175 RepID=UPI003D2BD689
MIFYGSIGRSGLNRSLAAVAMVLCWSSGFLVAKAASPFSEIGVFLLLRFSIAVCFFTVLSAVSRATWPNRKHLLLHCLSGALLQGGYLVAGYRAVETGLSVGAMTLMGAFQPTITAVVVSLLSGSPLRALVWQGLIVGTLGVFMVLGPQFSAADQQANWVGYSAAAIAVVSVTLGTLLQSKLLNQCDLAPAGALQNIGAAAVALSAAIFWDLWSWSSHPVLWIALFWASMGFVGRRVRATCQVAPKSGYRQRDIAGFINAPDRGCIELHHFRRNTDTRSNHWNGSVHSWGCYSQAVTAATAWKDLIHHQRAGN